MYDTIFWNVLKNSYGYQYIFSAGNQWCSNIWSCVQVLVTEGGRGRGRGWGRRQAARRRARLFQTSLKTCKDEFASVFFFRKSLPLQFIKWHRRKTCPTQATSPPGRGERNRDCRRSRWCWWGWTTWQPTESPAAWGEWTLLMEEFCIICSTSFDKYS